MKTLLKTSVGCLFIALALNVAFTSAQSTPWLQLNSHNPTKDPNLKPRWTVIITSVKPSIRQIGINRWEIEFTE